MPRSLKNQKLIFSNSQLGFQGQTWNLTGIYCGLLHPLPSTCFSFIKRAASEAVQTNELFIDKEIKEKVSGTYIFSPQVLWVWSHGLSGHLGSWNKPKLRSKNCVNILLFCCGSTGEPLPALMSVLKMSFWGWTNSKSTARRYHLSTFSTWR